MAQNPEADRPPPDPPIPRYRSQVFARGRVTDLGPALCCPRCSEATLVLLDTKHFDRARDGYRTNFVRVSSLTKDDPMVVTNYHLPQRRAPSQRNLQGLTVEFGCRSCRSVYDGPEHQGVGHGLWLEIIEEEGVVMSWVYDPTPEAYEAIKAAANDSPA